MRAVACGDGRIELRPESGAEEFMLRRMADAGVRVASCGYESRWPAPMRFTELSIVALAAPMQPAAAQPQPAAEGEDDEG